MFGKKNADNQAQGAQRGNPQPYGSSSARGGAPYGQGPGTYGQGTNAYGQGMGSSPEGGVPHGVNAFGGPTPTQRTPYGVPQGPQGGAVDPLGTAPSKADKKAARAAAKKAKAAEKEKKKKEPKVKEPEYFNTGTNIKALNYRVYYMSMKEKVLSFILAFLAGAVVAYIFYGGIGVDDLGQPTTLTYVVNAVLMTAAGTVAGILFVPMRRNMLLNSRKSRLKTQFRDMLEVFSTSLGAGRNVTDAFKSTYEDLKNQYEDGAYILNELFLINVGINNGLNVEDLLSDLGRRSGIEDITSFANVFEICYRRGGNIRDTVRNTADIIGDKMAIAEDIETMVTGSKNELYLMLVLPIVLIMLIKGNSADFARNFTTPTGIMSTTVALACSVGAYMLGQKILDIKM